MESKTADWWDQLWADSLAAPMAHQSVDCLAYQKAVRMDSHSAEWRVDRWAAWTAYPRVASMASHLVETKAHYLAEMMAAQ